MKKCILFLIFCLFGMVLNAEIQTATDTKELFNAIGSTLNVNDVLWFRFNSECRPDIRFATPKKFDQVTDPIPLARYEYILKEDSVVGFEITSKYVSFSQFEAIIKELWSRFPITNGESHLVIPSEFDNVSWTSNQLFISIGATTGYGYLAKKYNKFLKEDMVSLVVSVSPALAQTFKTEQELLQYQQYRKQQKIPDLNYQVSVYEAPLDFVLEMYQQQELWDDVQIIQKIEALPKYDLFSGSSSAAFDADNLITVEITGNRGKFLRIFLSSCVQNISRGFYPLQVDMKVSKSKKSQLQEGIYSLEGGSVYTQGKFMGNYVVARKGVPIAIPLISLAETEFKALQLPYYPIAILTIEESVGKN